MLTHPRVGRWHEDDDHHHLTKINHCTVALRLRLRPSLNALVAMLVAMRLERLRPSPNLFFFTSPHSPRPRTPRTANRIRPRSTASPSWILTSPQTKMPRLPYCHDVTFRFGAIITRRSRMLARDASFFSVISTASLWDWCLWRQCGEGMWICVSIEPASFNVFNHCTYCNGLFIMLFSQVSLSGEGTETRGP